MADRTSLRLNDMRERHLYRVSEVSDEKNNAKATDESAVDTLRDVKRIKEPTSLESLRVCLTGYLGNHGGFEDFSPH